MKNQYITKTSNYNTIIQYNIVFNKCKNLSFDNSIIKKNVTLLILKNLHKNEWMNIVKFSIIGIIFHFKKMKNNPDISNEKLYNIFMEEAKHIMKKKNSDYGDAWKHIKISSIKDLILQKILRIQNMQKNIQKNEKMYEYFFEKIKDNYIDILNYSIFSFIKEKIKIR